MADRRPPFSTIFFASVVAALAPCCAIDAEQDAPDGFTPAEPDASVCAAPGDPFAVGITKTSPEGMTVAIEDANPAPPGIGKNEWTIRIKDGTGNPVAGAVVNFSLYMPPPHNHPMTGTVGNDAGGGVYAASDINLTMPGLVNITVEVTLPGGRLDKVLFQFCVQRKGN